MSNVHIETVEDANGNLVDVIYYHGYCAPETADAWPCPESQDCLVYCKACEGWIEAIALTDDGARELLHNPFFAAYVECALWSSTDDEQLPLDESFDATDIDADSLAKMYDECRDFQRSNAELLEGIEDSQAGHDFWLTRNRHGAGFWDRGLGEVGTKLTDAAHVYGGCDLYVYERNGEKHLAI